MYLRCIVLIVALVALVACSVPYRSHKPAPDAAAAATLPATARTANPVAVSEGLTLPPILACGHGPYSHLLAGKATIATQFLRDQERYLAVAYDAAALSAPTATAPHVAIFSQKTGQDGAWKCQRLTEAGTLRLARHGSGVELAFSLNADGYVATHTVRPFGLVTKFTFTPTEHRRF